MDLNKFIILATLLISLLTLFVLVYFSNLILVAIQDFSIILNRNLDVHTELYKTIIAKDEKLFRLLKTTNSMKNKSYSERE